MNLMGKKKKSQEKGLEGSFKYLCENSCQGFELSSSYELAQNS